MGLDEEPDRCNCNEIRDRRLPNTPLRTIGLNFLATLGKEI